MVPPELHCNCRVKESCPLNGDCTQPSVVYGCKITSNDTLEDSPHYIGLTENTYHKNSFKYETKINSTKCSNYLWGKKKDKQEILFKWYIKEKGKAYSPVTKKIHVMSKRKVPYFIF